MQAEIDSTRKVSFAPGGTIRWKGSYGDLYIEAWDQPQVEITVMKSTNYYPPPVNPSKTSRLEEVKVVTATPSANELSITTSKHVKRVALEYRIYVPRNSRLVVEHHGGGGVTIGNVKGDIEATNRDGDIMLMLPGQGVYAIEARSKMGHIASDFPGSTHVRYLVGESFTSPSASSARRIHLRVGFGGITILALPPEGQGLFTAGSF
jgi:hypothetical protein